MQMAETILTMLRLSPLLAQEVQRCLNDSKTFHEIMSHLPRSIPSNDHPQAVPKTLDTSTKA